MDVQTAVTEWQAGLKDNASDEVLAGLRSKIVEAARDLTM
jgi:hypothetical protein